MAETLAGTWANFGGTEIVNNTRTLAYLRNGLGPGSLTIYGDCGCNNLIELLDCPEATGGYVSPVIDNAPWYSPDIPESADFLGFLAEEFTGLNSPFTRDINQNIGNGATPGRSRLAGRELVWRGYLFGATCCSVQYGLRWLAKALARFDAECRNCFGDDLEILFCCPDEPTTSSPFRLLKGVVLEEGPIIESERQTCTSKCNSGCGGSCIIEVEFTMNATQPYFYSPPIPILDCVSITDGAVGPYTQATIECGAPDCSDFLFSDAGICPLPELPPTANYTNSCAPDFDIPLATYYTVQRELWNELEEVVPVISITTGALPIIDGLKIGFYISATGDPCGDLVNYPPDCDVICDELTIIGLPANSTFYIDGRTKKMAVICQDGQAYPGERLTTGPWTWPTFDCFGFCMEVIHNQIGSEVNAAEQLACISLSLVPRTF